MDPVLNPYMPGAGRTPNALVGRDEVLARWDVSLQRAERGVADQPYVFYGLRGVGKTVLLTRCRHIAQQRDWWVVQAEAGATKTLREMVGEGLYEPLSELARPSLGARALRAIKTAVSLRASYDATGNWNFGVDLSGAGGGGADSGVLESDLRRVIRDVALAAKESGVGLALLVDEAQDLTKEELTTLAVVAQAAAQDSWPFLLGLAGLPSLPQRLAEAKSYSERFHHIPIEKLSADDAAAALRAPAEVEGVSWEADALALVVRESGGYPYFLQQFGEETWNEASGENIDLTAARVGVAKGQARLDQSFFRARWDRTTPAEKRYLRAMCPEGDQGIGSGVVAERLNKSLNQLGADRHRLIKKGLIYAPSHGVVRFTVPGMVGFIGRQID